MDWCRDNRIDPRRARRPAGYPPLFPSRDVPQITDNRKRPYVNTTAPRATSNQLIVSQSKAMCVLCEVSTHTTDECQYKLEARDAVRAKKAKLSTHSANFVEHASTAPTAQKAIDIVAANDDDPSVPAL
ncbi:hypothetical protein EDC01DRAFT_627479 [Geopyxis carbonaria]|nr:hypothetical protein EDC01DRAFT_627479 [Geopyxis carbonaria]